MTPIRFSHLKAMARSPLHAKHAMDDSREQTLSMRLGSATHSMILGGQPVVVYPGAVRRGKEWDAFKAEHDAAIIVNQTEHDTASAIASAVRGSPVASRVLFQPEMVYEGTILWEQSGRARRSTPDARGHWHLVELKTTRDAEPGHFQRDAVRGAYHAQLADQARAIESATGRHPRDVYVVAVENTPPHAVSVHRLTPGALERGRKLCDEWMGKLIECEQSGKWPSYADTIVDFDVAPDLSDLVWAEED